MFTRCSTRPTPTRRVGIWSGLSPAVGPADNGLRWFVAVEDWTWNCFDGFLGRCRGWRSGGTATVLPRGPWTARDRGRRRLGRVRSGRELVRAARGGGAAAIQRPRYQVGFEVEDIETAREPIQRGVVPISEIEGSEATSRWAYFPSPRRQRFRDHPATDSVTASDRCRVLATEYNVILLSGSNSAGRVPPSQGGCRGFEPRLPLHSPSRTTSRVRLRFSWRWRASTLSDQPIRRLPAPRPSRSRANAAVSFRLRSWYESSPAPMAAAGGSRFFGLRHAERVADGGDRFTLVLADMFATDSQDTPLPRRLGHHLRDG